jgi:hypothetical protein
MGVPALTFQSVEVAAMDGFIRLFNSDRNGVRHGQRWTAHRNNHCSRRSGCRDLHIYLIQRHEAGRASWCDFLSFSQVSCTSVDGLMVISGREYFTAPASRRNWIFLLDQDTVSRCWSD